MTTADHGEPMAAEPRPTVMTLAASHIPEGDHTRLIRNLVATFFHHPDRMEIGRVRCGVAVRPGFYLKQGQHWIGVTLYNGTVPINVHTASPEMAWRAATIEEAREMRARLEKRRYSGLYEIFEVRY